MTRFGRRDQAFAVALAALAGYVDAIGFLKAGGFFVSFMSGNSTRLAVGLVRGTPQPWIAGVLILSFVGGVVLGTVLGERSVGGARVNLLAVAGLLALAAAADFRGYSFVSIFIAAAAMGAENTTFARDGDVQIGLTYMTGTLVKFGQRLAYAFLGRGQTMWLPYAFLWLGLLFGAVLGAIVYGQVGVAGLWAAALTAAVLAFSGARRNA